MGLVNIKNLSEYKAEKIYKLDVFVPENFIDTVRNAMTAQGAGWIGNYSNCTFTSKGKGTFKPLHGTEPFIGKQGNVESVDEYKLETVVPLREL